MAKKKVIAVVVLIAGLAVSFFVLADSQKKSSNKETLNFAVSAESKNPQLDYRLPTGFSQKASLSKTLTVEKGTDNFTEILARSYVKQAIGKNNKLSSTNSAEEIISQIAEAETVERKIFQPKDIKTIADNSTEAQKKYLEAIDAALLKNFSWLKKDILTIINEFTQRQESKTLDELINAIPNYINDLLRIETPKKLEIIHLQLLNLWQKKLTTYQAIREIEGDPLKAYVALQQIPGIIQEDTDLRTILIEYYENINKPSPQNP